MNKEEAITNLESLRQILIGSPIFDKVDNEAIDMAIEALNREQKKYDAICDELLELKSDLMLPIEVAMAVVMKYAKKGGSE